MANTKKYHVNLTDEEVSSLKKLAKSADSKKIIRKRINILQYMDEAHGKPLTYKQCVKSNASSIMNAQWVQKHKQTSSSCYGTKEKVCKRNSSSESAFLE